MVFEVLCKLSLEYQGDRTARVEGIEHVMKGTLVAQTLPLFASVVSSETCLRLSWAKSFLPSVTTVTVMASKVREMLGKKHLHSCGVLLNEVLCFAQVAYLISEMKSVGDGKVDEVPSTTIPSPWVSPRKVETPHPVRDDYQYSKTVVLPGAPNLYLKFDPRCATQYEYDKVMFL